MAYDLKSESEVKEYIHNLGIEYRFGCYSEKKPEVCHLLGDYLEAVKKDFEKAGKVFKNNCDEYNYAKSCHKFGNFSLLGRGQGRENFQDAYKYFEKGCTLNEPDSCFHQGLMLVTNNDKTKIEKNVVKGMSVLEKACEGNNSTACHYLSGMYICGIKKPETQAKGTEVYEVPKDMTKAFNLALKGCNLGNMYSCANLSQMYRRGEGTKKDEATSELYKKKAIELQDEALNTKSTLTFQEGLSS